MWTQEKIEEAMQRSEMAASVEIPIDQFRELLRLASKAHELQKEVYLLKPLPIEFGE